MRASILTVIAAAPLLSGGALGCGVPDSCDDWCAQSAVHLDRCLSDWGWTWEALSQEDGESWSAWCRGYWDAQKKGAEEEGEEALRGVMEQCDEGLAQESGEPSCADLLEDWL